MIKLLLYKEINNLSNEQFFLPGTATIRTKKSFYGQNKLRKVAFVGLTISASDETLITF